MDELERVKSELSKLDPSSKEYTVGVRNLQILAQIEQGKENQELAKKREILEHEKVVTEELEKREGAKNRIWTVLAEIAKVTIPIIADVGITLAILNYEKLDVITSKAFRRR